MEVKSSGGVIHDGYFKGYNINLGPSIMLSCNNDHCCYFNTCVKAQNQGHPYSRAFVPFLVGPGPCNNFVEKKSNMG